MLGFLLACASVPTPGDSDGSQGDSGPPESWDVVVVGTGPAGIAAAWAASEAGAESVLMLDRAQEPATGLTYAGLAYGAVTRWQAEAGVADSIELAALEWEQTTGASAESGGARQFIEESAAVLEWLETHHVPLRGPVSSGDGSVPRLHELAFEPGDDRFALVMDGFEGEVRVDAEVVAPLVDEGRVVGVRWVDTITGIEAEIGARSVVLASGGFLRDLDAVGAVRPDLVEREPVFETNLNSVGSTLPFLEQVGAGREQPEQIGTYFHSVADPRLAGGSEALIVVNAASFVLVGSDGRRFTADSGLAEFDVVAAAPPGPIWLIAAGGMAEDVRLSPPAYNWASISVPEAYTPAEVQAWGSADIVMADSLAALAVDTGLGDTLVTEVELFNDLANAGTTDVYGRELHPSDALNGPPWLALRLRPGLAKNFGGVATDLDGRVLDADGEPVPGLYAAGEVAGMVTGGGSGTGFSGSGGACFAGGRRAGTRAVTD